ncbi:E3 ubiquitin-protein ligase UPL1 [Striga asiatica]|uniref:HECT-type E3 ubiquitin transferase n=1 Tax=Striga asiatica TaxID=4170 RepID=A0A5A7PJ03_STRAF|nr:E3 ubiquitin-protein ligase UPL1 [Striga asiatica]
MYFDDLLEKAKKGIQQEVWKRSFCRQVHLVVDLCPTQDPPPHCIENYYSSKLRGFKLTNRDLSTDPTADRDPAGARDQPEPATRLPEPRPSRDAPPSMTRPPAIRPATRPARPYRSFCDPDLFVCCPSRIKSFINQVTATPLENIEEPLKSFSWEFDKGDFHHWVDLFNHFDTFFEKYIKPRKDLQLEENFLESDPPFPRDAVLQILRVIRVILENCTNKHFYSSYELVFGDFVGLDGWKAVNKGGEVGDGGTMMAKEAHHLSSLLASTDADVVEACLQTLAAFLKKSIGKYIIRDVSLNSRLVSFAQGWGGKEEGLGLVSCALQNGADPIAFELGSTLHFEFYAMNISSNEPTASEQPTQGLQTIHMPDVNAREESDLELLNKLIVEYKVPHNLRFSLLTRLRFAKAFGSLETRQQYTCIRLYAFVVLVQACSNTEDLVSFFNTEPEFINELVTMLSIEDAVPEKIRILCLLSLVALCQDRSRQPTVLTAVTSGGHRGILSSLMQKAIGSVVSDSSKWSVVFAEALLSLVTVLVSSSSGCSAMREAGFIPTLLPLLKDTDPQHLHLVSTAVHVLEAFMDYSNPAAVLFRDLGGLDDTISRLMVEVSHVENGLKQQTSSGEHSESGGSQVISDASSTVLDSLQPPHSGALVSYHRRLLMKALLRAISLGTYAPGTAARMYGTEESLLPHCLCIIFKRAKDFGGGVFSLAATVMSDLIHKDPTCFSVLEAAGLPSAFMDAIMDGVLCSAEAITCIPQCLDALCLNNNGLQAVKERDALRCFVKVFTSKTYLRALTADTSGSLSSGLDELMRHAASLRGSGVDMLIEILTNIAKIGSGLESASPSSDPPSSSQPVLMETESENRDVILVDDKESSRHGTNEQLMDIVPDTSSLNVESSLPDYISNVARLLETVLQNSDTCRIFVEKKGIECVLQLFSLPLLPLSVSLGQSIAVAFKNFSPQHSTSLARAVCTFLREHLRSTEELLTSIKGRQLVEIEFSHRVKILRCLTTLEGILSLSISLLKGTTTLVSELGSADADVLKELGKTYREIQWQVSLCCELKVEEKSNAEVEPDNTDAGPSNVAGRESDDDSNIPSIRYMNPLSIRNSSHSQWGVERDFISVVRSSEGFSRRSRHSLARLHGGRAAGRHLEALQIDTESGTSSAKAPSHGMKTRSPEMVAVDILNKLASTICSFFTALVKGFTSPTRRRTETGPLSSASKAIGTALAKVFLDSLGFSGYTSSTGVDVSLSVKCRYLGKVVDDMAALTFDNRRRTCYASMINKFYVHGTFKELLTTFEATSQLLWTVPCAISAPGSDHEKSGEGSKLSHSLWLLDTLQSHCRELEYFVNSGILLSSTSTSQAQLLVQPVAVGLSIGLFPVPRDPEALVRMLQSQVLDVILPVWNHPMFPNCSPGFITSIVSLLTHVYNGVSDIKTSRNGLSGAAHQRFMPPPPDEATIATIVEMGFSRARAEEALRRVETNSVEMAMEWLFSHAEDPVQEDDELARALALSLGNSTESPKVDGADKSADVLNEEGNSNPPLADNVLAVATKLFEGSDALAFPLTDLLVTLCSRNKGEERSKVISYLVQQLKLCALDFSNDSCALGRISHTLALLLAEDGVTREIAAENGIAVVVIDILMNFMSKTEALTELHVPKCISALLLILDDLVQSRPRIPGDNGEGVLPGSLSGALGNQASSEAIEDKSVPSDVCKDNDSAKDDSALEKVFGKPTGYLSMEESHKVLVIVCNLMKRHVPSIIMQAALQLCARLTKSHALALQFLENGGLVALFGLPMSCFFPGYDTLASAIVRHLLEDPHTLQSAMEVEIRQTLSGSRYNGRISAKTFLTLMAPVISRDPGVFMKSGVAVCQVESVGGRTMVVLSKDKDKEKEKLKSSETGVSTNECVRITEQKTHDGSNKYSKGYKKVSANLTQVIDYLLEIVSTYPSVNVDDDCGGHPSAMEVDEPTLKMKGKSKVDETVKTGSDSSSEKAATLAKVTFVLKLLSDILLMYVQVVGVILRRDLEMCQQRGSSNFESPGQGGVVHHLLHCLLPLSMDKSAGPDEWRDKLAEKASWFLVVLAGRSSEGRRRVVNELVKALSQFINVQNNSSSGTLLPDKKVLAYVDLVYSILSKNSSSGNLPGSGCSPDIAKSMIDGGVVHCLSSILQVVDLDHPEAPKVVNLILKSLESLTRAANASEQLLKANTLNKKKVNDLSGSAATQLVGSGNSQLQSAENGSSQHGLMSNGRSESQPAGISWENGSNSSANPNQPQGQEMRIEEHPANDPHVDLGMDYMHDDMEESGALPNTEQIEIAFHVQTRVDDDMNEEEDGMGDDGEDDDDAEDEDDAIGEGTGLMSLADTDIEDHDDAGLGDEYNDEMVDEEDDDFHENNVIEVRWREALDGLDHLQVLGQPGAGGGLIDVSAEAFEGVNVDDFFGIRRTFGFERRRQTNRTSYERSVADGNGLQHPLLSRPLNSGDIGSTSAGNSRDSEGLSAGNHDLAQFYMFDAPVLPYDSATNLFGGSGPQQLADFSVGLESLRGSSRRGRPGDGRWSDDGQPQGDGQAAVIAQAVEDQFISLLSNNNSPERLEQNVALPERQERAPTSATDALLIDDHHISSIDEGAQPDEVNREVLSGREGQQEAQDIRSDVGDDRMETGDVHNVGGQDLETYLGSVAPDSVLSDRGSENPPTSHGLSDSGTDITGSGDFHASVPASGDVYVNATEVEGEQAGTRLLLSEINLEEPSQLLNNPVVEDADQTEESNLNNEAPNNANGIDPTFLEALPEDLRAEVLASQQARTAAPSTTYAPPRVEEDIDPEFLAALPPDIQAEVLAQQRAQRIAQQSEGQPVDMDNASIIATFPADLREEVLLTSSEALLSALPSPLLAEAQMLRDRAMSHYHARSLFGGNQRLNRANRLGFDRQTAMDRGVGVSIGRRAAYVAENLKLNEIDGEPLLDANGLKALIRLLRLAQPLGKGLLQRLLLNLCSHSDTRAILVRLLVDMIKPETSGVVGGVTSVNTQRLYGCQSNVVYGRSQLCDGVPPLVLRRVLENLTYLATNHSGVSSLLCHFESSNIHELSSINHGGDSNGKGKNIIGGFSENSQKGDIPLILLLRLLREPLFLRSMGHLEQVMGLLQVVICVAASKVDALSNAEETAPPTENPSVDETAGSIRTDTNALGAESQLDQNASALNAKLDDQRTTRTYDVFLLMPQSDLHNLCSLLGHEGLSDKVYTLAGDVLMKLASVASVHRRFFILELSESAERLSTSAVNELVKLRNTQMLGLSAGSMAGAAILRVLQILSSLISIGSDSDKDRVDGEEQEEQVTMCKLNAALEPLWKELSDCISTMENELSQRPDSSIVSSNNSTGEQIQGSSSATSPLPPGTQRLLPFIEGFFVLCENLLANNSTLQQDLDVTAREVKESAGSSVQFTKSMDAYKKTDGSITFVRFAEKHRRLLNAFVRQNPGLLEKSLSMMLDAPRLIDFDNKRAYFRSRIRQQHDQHLSGPLRISVRRAYILEDSYNQLRMRSTQDLKGRLNVHFQGEEGIDAGGLTREWYQLLSRVIFDKGALLFTTVGNDATFQPNPNSVYQTEHLSYFKFIGRVVAKALFDGQLLDVYFTRSFYKHILGVKVTYHDIEAVDPDYYKNLKWMLENDVSDIPDLTFSMDADEEKHILYEKTEVTDYELKPGGRNIRVMEETKHEYVDLVADHILTNAIRPQINSFLEGFNELVPRELISIFNDKELELLISGLPEIDLADLKANTEYTGYTPASSVVQWFWEVVEAFSKEDMARFLQFVTGTSKVPLEGFKALQGISGPQKFQIHKAYGAPERLPSAHTCFNQLDLPEYSSKEQLQGRLFLAIHEASEGFGFG